MKGERLVREFRNLLLGTLLCASSGAGSASETTSYKYDPLGRLIEVARSDGPANGVNSVYCLDRAGNRRFVRVGGVGTGGNPSSNCRSNSNGSDFNGDGIDDILFLNDSGTLTDWFGPANGVTAQNNASYQVGVGWKIVGRGDFNGDGRDDLLWRQTATGALAEWIATSSGGFASNAIPSPNGASLDWKVASVGDFNGDGYADIVWLQDTGFFSEWLGSSSGALTDNGSATSRNVGTSWGIAGTGDFNGDGRRDIIWRNSDGAYSEWLGQSDGGFIDNYAIAGGTALTSWQIVGVGDFNGDGRADILWQNPSANVLVNWLGKADGSFMDNTANTSYSVPSGWSLAAVADYNGDGRQDILWRHISGTVTDWLGNANGSFTENGANFAVNVGTDWHIQ